jgi:hypothetical protein
MPLIGLCQWRHLNGAPQTPYDPYAPVPTTVLIHKQFSSPYTKTFSSKGATTGLEPKEHDKVTDVAGTNNHVPTHLDLQNLIKSRRQIKLLTLSRPIIMTSDTQNVKNVGSKLCTTFQS